MWKNFTFSNILQKIKSYFLPISIILRLIPIEIPKKYKTEDPYPTCTLTYMYNLFFLSKFIILSRDLVPLIRHWLVVHPTCTLTYMYNLLFLSKFIILSRDLVPLIRHWLVVHLIGCGISCNDFKTWGIGQRPVKHPVEYENHFYRIFFSPICLRKVIRKQRQLYSIWPGLRVPPQLRGIVCVFSSLYANRCTYFEPFLKHSLATTFFNLKT